MALLGHLELQEELELLDLKDHRDHLVPQVLLEKLDHQGKLVN